MVEDNNIDVNKMSKVCLFLIRVILIICTPFIMLSSVRILAEVADVVLEYNTVVALLAVIVCFYILYKYIKFFRYLFSKTKFDIIIKNISSVIFWIIITVILNLIYAMITNDYECILFAMIGMSGPVLLLPLLAYLRSNFIKQLKNINETQLKKELQSPQKNIYINKMLDNIYITENFVYAQGSSVAYINDVLWMYKEDVNFPIRIINKPYLNSNIFVRVNLVLCLNNNKKVYVAIKDYDTLNKIIDDIQKRNTNIFVGNTAENKKRYKQLLKK